MQPFHFLQQSLRYNSKPTRSSKGQSRCHYPPVNFHIRSIPRKTSPQSPCYRPTYQPPSLFSPLADPTLDAIMLLSSKFDEQAKITQKKLEAQQDEINALRSQFSVLVSSPPQQYQQFQPRGRQQRPCYTKNSRRPFQYPATQFQPDGFPMHQSSDWCQHPLPFLSRPKSFQTGLPCF